MKARDLIKSMTYYHKERSAFSLPASADSIYYPIDYISQVHVNLCTDTCNQMLNKFAKQPFHTMHHNPRGLFEGVFPNELTDSKGMGIYLRSDIDVTTDSIRQKLANGPFIMALPIRGGEHSVLCVGISGSEVIYHDPLTSGNKCIHIEVLGDLINRYGENSKLQINERPGLRTQFVDSKRVVGFNPKNLHRNEVRVAREEYGRFFSQKSTASNNPCAAIREFLADYAYDESIIHHRRHHREAVIKFLNSHLEINDVQELLAVIKSDLLNSLDLKQGGGLDSRLQTIFSLYGDFEPEETARSGLSR